MLENIVNIGVAFVCFSFFYFVLKRELLELAGRVAYKSEFDLLKEKVCCNSDNIKALDAKLANLYGTDFVFKLTDFEKAEDSEEDEVD